MPDLYITQALPNPQGKDRPPYGGPSNDQLNGEWLEFKNNSGKQLSLSGLELRHRTYTANCQHTGDATVVSFSQVQLSVDQSIRVHTGSGQDHWMGGIFHYFLGRSNYVWNNRCGDIATLAISGKVIDWALYVGNPTEGKVLRRLAENLLS